MSQENYSPSKQSLANCLEQLRRAGCEVREQAGGRHLVVRDGCGAVLEALAGGGILFSVSPGFIQGDRIAHLVDRGFQKFWQDDDRRIPARASELKALHELERDLRAALGVTTLYNEALGTVSWRYVYDRLEGREPGKRHPSFD
ncbi:MAG: hypothetical protein HY316_02850 [Acidobacteria bacterium]|nr:hypothetical protein [Acidobacteriota bacterium]